MTLRQILIIASTALLAACSGPGAVEPDTLADKLPPMTPDYSGTPTLPRNIAPLRFRIDLPADDYQAAFGRAGEQPQVVVNSTDGVIAIDTGDWERLLESAAGDTIVVALATRRAGSDWVGYPQMRMAVDTAALTDWLVYRKLFPGYELWNDLGIYQRCPYTYDEEALLDNKDADRQCLNCHNFAAGQPDNMMLHVRGAKGGTIIVRPGKEPVKLRPTAAGTDHGATYPAWHPSGRYIAFSANDIQQFFHTSGSKTTEVVDMAADMMVYDVERGTGYTDSLVAGPRYVETFPTWTPDGRTLYFCRANPVTGPESIDSVRYDLVRRNFDPATGRFEGEVEVVYPAAAKGLSASFPRVSPDGRWLLLTLSSYGNFSIWHPEADLALIDLRADSIAPRLLDEVNAPDAVDSYHSWSTDGRWIVFSSKRIDGLYTRPYIARFDATTGRFGAPFVLPQSDPGYYERLLKSYNVPEFVSGRVPHADALRRLANE